nr:PREDICTED: uncharacterized protein LOC105677334 [Linepithema humile]
MKWFLMLMTIAIWQCIQVTGNPVSQRKPRIPINPMSPTESPFSPYRDAEVVNPLSIREVYPFYKGFRRAIKKESEHATKNKSNDKEEKPTSHIRKRDIVLPSIYKWYYLQIRFFMRFLIQNLDPLISSSN